MSRKKPAGGGAVGYCRPPVHSQFKPGCSGNPRGRPKGRPQDFGSMLADVLATKVPVIEHGRKRMIAFGKLVATNMVTAAAKGDAKARSELRQYVKAFPLPVEARDHLGSPIDYGAEVRAKLELMAERLKEQRLAESGTAGRVKPDET